MGPVFFAATRLRLRRALRAKGYRPLQVNALVDDASDEVIEATADSVSGTREAVGAIGDGSFIEAFLKFLESDLGKALIDALLKLLLGA